MDNKKPSNPFAFPCWDEDGQSIEKGLTMRDYFAAKALSNTYMGVNHEDESAKRAYKMADAMLKEREK